MKTLKYGITHIETGDKAKDMPTAAEQTAQAIVAALDAFNYDGADPSLVLSRVVALETYQGTRKGTAAQRAAALANFTNGELWQDTDGTKLLYRKDGGVWVPQHGSKFRAVKTSGAVSNIQSLTAISGLTVSFTLAAALEMMITVAFSGYSDATDNVTQCHLRDNASSIYSWTFRPNSAGAATGQAWTLAVPLTFAAGSHSLTIALQRAAGTGGYYIAPSTTGNAMSLEARV